MEYVFLICNTMLTTCGISAILFFVFSGVDKDKDAERIAWIFLKIAAAFFLPTFLSWILK